jgi:hypothetical protein
LGGALHSRSWCDGKNGLFDATPVTTKVSAAGHKPAACPHGLARDRTRIRMQIMLPFWTDVPVTVWLQMAALVVAVAGWITGVCACQAGQR